MKTMEQVHAILDMVSYKSWFLLVSTEDGRPYLQWSFEGKCANTGKIEHQPCRKWFLSFHMTDGELVQTAFGAALQAEEHECREFFLYGGHRVMNPHLSLEALVSRAHMTEGRT